MMLVDKSRILFGHFIFWFIYFLYVWLPESSINDDKYEQFFWVACWNVPIVMVGTYFTIYNVERNLLEKRHLRFWIALAFSMVVFATVRRYVNYTFTYPMLWPEKLKQPLFYFPKMIFDAVHVHLIASVGAMIYVLNRWKEQQRLAETYKMEKIAAELELLKSQVQPHFIFNTLNNIYMLSLKNSPQTSDMIYRLSALLSYMLYDSKKPMISLDKEIDYIKNYINLEKIRYGERLDVQMNVYKNLHDLSVPPLLLLPLVENAIKHGVSNEVENCWINIDVVRKDNSVTFKIENSVVERYRSPSIDKDFGNGLGLRNLEQRLNIQYPNRHELKIMSDDSAYLVVLRIDCEHYTEGGENELAVPESTVRPARVLGLAPKLSAFLMAFLHS